MGIEIRNLTKSFGAFRALDGVSLEINDGELLALLGPSGSGKTTLLRLIAGLEAPDAGGIVLNGRRSTERRPLDGEVGFVFQHYALFPTMSVFENVAFGLRVRPGRTRPSREAIRRRVMDLLEMVHLGDLASRFPAELSGGQRQRVALARALAVEPKALLLDEPFGALDARVRQELRERLRGLHRELGITTVFVTHDQQEALELADRVVVMNQGRIEQVGSPGDVYDNPVSEFVLRFMGHANPIQGLSAGYARPHEIKLQRFPSDDAIRVRILEVRALGSMARIELEREDNRALLHVEVTRERLRELDLSPGDSACAVVENIHYFDDPAPHLPAPPGLVRAGGLAHSA